jgi:hypothetical protein
LREKLEQAEPITEASETLQELFCKKIESMMKDPTASTGVNAPLSDLELDSLLAVEIRTWLLKDMHLDVSLFRILGRDPMSSICSIAARKLVEDRAAANESKPTRTQGMPTGPETAPAALETDESNTTDQSDSSASRTEDSQHTGSADSISPSGNTTPLEFATHSDSKSLETHQGVETSSAWSVYNSATTRADLDEPMFVLEYKRTERMSFAHASLHFLYNFLDDRTSFNVTAQYDIRGQLHVTKFARALEKTLARHEAYQTCFLTEPGSLELTQGNVSNFGS